MSGLMKFADEKAHERTITIATYPAHQSRVIVEGRLVDRRLKDNYLLTGEKRPAALQGIFSSRAQKPMDLPTIMADPSRIKFFMKTMLNTCYVWREDGPALNKLLELVEGVRKGVKK